MGLSRVGDFIGWLCLLKYYEVKCTFFWLHVLPFYWAVTGRRISHYLGSRGWDFLLRMVLLKLCPHQWTLDVTVDTLTSNIIVCPHSCFSQPSRAVQKFVYLMLLVPLTVEKEKWHSNVNHERCWSENRTRLQLERLCNDGGPSPKRR